MTPKDARGHPVTLSDPSALDGFERALESLRTYRGDPLAHLDGALLRAPDFAAAHAAKALILMTFFERRFAREALGALEAGASAIDGGTDREKALAQAARTLAGGDWHQGVRILDGILVDHPRDILALQVAHLVDFNRGDALNLRNRVSRILPAWEKDVPGYPFVLGMHAFGLEECNQYPEAEAAGMRALELAPEDCWAVHAVTHVMEMQGRIDEGARFLERRTGDWATEDNGFAFHNWWHLALFHMDRADHGAALGIYDRALASALGMAMSRLDATSLLWRLRLEGADVGSRFDPVADSWAEALEGEGGFYAFNDFHAAMAFAGAGRTREMGALRAVLDRAARRDDANGEMTRSVALDLVDGFEAFGSGDWERAVERIGRARDIASRFGGSHAQRDVLTLTLIEAARRGGRARLAEHLVRERLTHKPASAWGHRLVERIHAGETRARQAA